MFAPKSRPKGQDPIQLAFDPSSDVGVEIHGSQIPLHRDRQVFEPGIGGDHLGPEFDGTHMPTGLIEEESIQFLPQHSAAGAGVARSGTPQGSHANFRHSRLGPTPMS
jgi:hypothetical protein